MIVPAPTPTPRLSRLLFLCVLVIVCHTATGYLEEVLFKRLAFKSAFYMVLVMCTLFVVGFLMARLARIMMGSEGEPIIPPGVLEAFRSGHGNRVMVTMMCGAYVSSNVLSKLCLNFVSVPTMIVVKSCKLVCVMAGSKLITGRVYSWFEYGIAAGLVSGMISFSLADMKGPIPSLDKDAMELFGLLLLLLALCCDSVLGNLQEKVQKSKVCDELSLMLLQSLASAALLLVWTAFSGELVEGIYQCQRDPRILIALLSWAISNMAGIVVMLRIVGEFSAVTAVVLSLVRKIFSLFVSYAFFPKVFNGGHAVGLLLVFFSVVLHSFRRQFFALLDTYTSQTDAGKLARPAISDDDVAMHHMQTTKA